MSNAVLAQHMEAVARHLLGDPNPALSSKRKLRYGAHGSLVIDLEKGIWFDHENQVGGGVLKLIEREHNLANGSAVTWMRVELGFDLPDSANQAVATYDYVDEHGGVLFQAVRYEPKTFRQRRPDGRGGWQWSLGNVRRVPFRLPELLAANERTVHIVEGEKDVLALEGHGLVATTNPGGAGKWRPEYAHFFRGADVVILPDNDPPGQQHAQDVAKSLTPIASRVRIVRLPGLPPKGDVSDWLRGGGTAEKLAQLCSEAGVSAAEAPNAPQDHPIVLRSADFVRGFAPPSYLLDGVLQSGFLYSLTGATGSGKTAIALRLLASTALGRPIGNREVERGRCLMLVGENPDDVRARWIALAEQMSFDADEIDAHFMPGVAALQDLLPKIEHVARAHDGLALVVVDTSPAYFQGDDENSNKELGDHARQIRALTRVAGNPCVVANCHPTKNATADNLLPRGGGAFIAEVDGNLCCSKADRIVELHWQGKFRGPDFDPIPFELVSVTSRRLVDTRGRFMPTVVARTLSEAEQAVREDSANHELQKLLAEMAEHPGGSIADLAEHAGWTIKDGKPHKSKVSRLLGELKKQKLVDKVLNVWTLTAAGERAAKRGAK